MSAIEKREETLFNRISSLIENARDRVKTAIDTAMVYTYYAVGQYIVEDEQQGADRAQYGKAILKKLSERLTQKHGKGWSVETLTLCRKFYNTYSNSVNTVYEIEDGLPHIDSVTPTTKTANISQTVGNKTSLPSFSLSWSHYLVLMRIDNPAARSFYEIEARRENWSVRQLQRQYNSSLYERLALSRNKEEVLRLSREGQTIEKPDDIIKNPLTLEFLGLQPEAVYSESKLENAIINKLQQFLLELGKGFLFEARQKCITFEEEHFFVDLVFYNRLLQCYVLVDLKIDKLTHQDLGQMLMYVNYYNEYVKRDFEKPTIGILLCREKKDALVKLTLPKDANIYAAEYALYLPDKKSLQSKLKQWIDEFEQAEEIKKLNNISL